MNTYTLVGVIETVLPILVVCLVIAALIKYLFKKISSMALILVLIITSIVYFIRRKKFISKTITLKIWGFLVYGFFVIIALLVFFEIVHIIKYHETSL